MMSSFGMDGGGRLAMYNQYIHAHVYCMRKIEQQILQLAQDVTICLVLFFHFAK